LLNQKEHEENQKDRVETKQVYKDEKQNEDEDEREDEDQDQDESDIMSDEAKVSFINYFPVVFSFVFYIHIYIYIYYLSSLFIFHFPFFKTFFDSYIMFLGECRRLQSRACKTKW